VLTRRLGLTVDLMPSSTCSSAIEVYPHPAMVSWFALDRVIPYKAKPGRTVADRARAFQRLLALMEQHLGSVMGLAESPAWQRIRALTAGAARQVDLDRVEDEIDAVCCAHLAWLWANGIGSLDLHGDLDSGFIVAPPPPSRRQGLLPAVTNSALQRTPQSGHGQSSGMFRHDVPG
jgi:predicted RNase H-like nuclease